MPDQDDVKIEAYGTVTPPPEEDGDDEPGQDEEE